MTAYKSICPVDGTPLKVIELPEETHQGYCPRCEKYWRGEGLRKNIIGDDETPEDRYIEYSPDFEHTPGTTN